MITSAVRDRSKERDMEGLFNEYINPEAIRSSWNIRAAVIDPFTGRALTEKEEQIVEEIGRRLTEKEDSG